MRKITLVTFVLLVVAALAVAQQGNSPQAPASPNHESTPQAPSTASPNQESAPQAPSTASPNQESAPQAPSNARPNEESAPQASAAETAIEGCLGGSAGNYTVTDKSGMVYKLELPDDSHNSTIDKHVGQEVRVTGTLANASAPDSAGEPDSRASKDEKSAKSQTLKPTSLEKIGDTCSAKGEAPPEKK